MQDHSHSTTTAPADDSRFCIVGCQNCNSLLVVERASLHQQETVDCRHCTATHAGTNLRVRGAKDTLNAARELRSRMMAARAGADDWAQGEHDTWAEIETTILEDRDRCLIDHPAVPTNAEERADQIDLVPIPGEPDPDVDVETSIDTPLDAATQAEADAYVERKLASGPTIETTDAVVDPTQQDVDVSCTPGVQEQVDSVVLSDAGPRRSAWLPEMIDSLLPALVREIRARAQAHESAPLTTGRASAFVADLLADLDLVAYDPDVDGADASVSRAGFDAAAEFVAALAAGVVERAAATDDTPTTAALAEEIAAAWCDPETESPNYCALGTGEGPLNAGLDAVFLGLVRPLRSVGDVPAVTIRLDGAAWADVSDARTRERALNAIAVVAAGTDVRLVVSPATKRLLARRHEEWFSAACTLSPAWDRYRQDPADPDGDTVPAIEELHATVAEYGTGHRRLLKAIQQEREQRTLADDPDVDLDASSVSAYLGDLETDGLVERSTAGRTNTVAPTDRSDAIRPYLTPDGDLRDPHQTDWSAEFTDPRHESDKCSVTREAHGTATPAGAAGGGGPRASAEAAIVQTGDPDDGAEYIQPLEGRSETGVMDRYGAHRRLSAVSRGAGVTLHDYQIDGLEDGRVAYYSAFDDEALAVLQWGDPLAMLVRLTRTLLSDIAFGKVLTREAAGTHLERLFDGQFGTDTPAALRDGSQCGWLSEDEEDYAAYRERLDAVAKTHLERLSTIDRGDTGARSELFSDALGLLGTAAFLYRAADVNLQITIRMPDTEQVRTDNTQRANFVRFLREVIPRCSAYGIHNAYRHLCETRGEKLKQRRSAEVDPTDPTGTPVPQIVVTGPTASALRPAAEQAVDAITEDLREPVRNGDEETFGIEVPVRVANGYAGARSVLEAFVEEKDYGESPVRKLVDVLRAVLRTEDSGVSPADVAEACLHLARASRQHATLTVEDLQHGLGNVPADRLAVSEVAPSAGKMLQAVLASDEPLTADELVAAAGVSKRSYERHRSLLVGLGVIDQTDGGWEATLIPWWSPYWAPDSIHVMPGQPETPAAALEQVVDEGGLLPPPVAEKLLSGVSKGSSIAPPDSGPPPEIPPDRRPLLRVLRGYINPHYDAEISTNSGSTAVVVGPPTATSTTTQTPLVGGAD